jgi:hypothetical protein
MQAEESSRKIERGLVVVDAKLGPPVPHPGPWYAPLPRSNHQTLRDRQNIVARGQDVPTRVGTVKLKRG